MRLGSSQIKYKSTHKPLSWDFVKLHIDEVRFLVVSVEIAIKGSVCVCLRNQTDCSSEVLRVSKNICRFKLRLCGDVNQDCNTTWCI